MMSPKNTTLTAIIGLGLSAFALPAAAQDTFDGSNLNCADFLAMGPSQMTDAVDAINQAASDAMGTEAGAMNDGATTESATDDDMADDSGTDTAMSDDAGSESALEAAVAACRENPDTTVLEALHGGDM